MGESQQGIFHHPIGRKKLITREKVTLQGFQKGFSPSWHVLEIIGITFLFDKIHSLIVDKNGSFSPVHSANVITQAQT
jgi:hypothetical protein